LTKNATQSPTTSHRWLSHRLLNVLCLLCLPPCACDTLPLPPPNLQSIWQGIDSVLVPNFGGSGAAKVASEAGNKTGRRMLAAVTEAVQSTAARTLNYARGDGYSQS
jgi:hypothetical protein